MRDNHYLVEYRFMGNIRQMIRKMIFDLKDRFKIVESTKKRVVPHITLAGPFQTDSENRLCQDFIDLCAHYPPMDFSVKGFGCFPKQKVVFINIEPGVNLDNFRLNLANRLTGYCSLKHWDLYQTYNYHATIAMKLTDEIFLKIIKHIQNTEYLEFKNHVLRITMLKNSKIMYEYDLVQRRVLDREEALDRNLYRVTLNNINKYMSING